MKKNYYAKALALTVAASMVSVPAFAAEENDAATLQADVEKGIATLPLLNEERPVVVAEPEEEEPTETPVETTTHGTTGDEAEAVALQSEDSVISEDTEWTDATTLSEDLTIAEGKTLTLKGQVTISGDVTISGGTIKRGADFTGDMIIVPEDSSLTLEGVTVDGGAVWEGDTDETLAHGMENSGIKAEKAAITVKGGRLTLNNDAVVQNNERIVGTDTEDWIEYQYTNANEEETVRYYAAGGGISVVGGSITVNDGAEVKNNAILDSAKLDGTTDAIGGGIGLYDCKSLIMNGGKISGNRAYSTGDARAMGGGIGVIAHPDSKYNNCSVEVRGGEIKNNVSFTSGGGAYLTSDCVNKTDIDALNVSCSGGTFSNNKTDSNGGGGGAMIWGCTAAMSGDVTFTKNNARNGFGGGVYFSTNTDVTVNGGTYSDNIGKNGGGIGWANGSEFEFKAGTVSGNTAEVGGGMRIYNNTAENPAVISGGTISSNTSMNGHGGGIAADYIEVTGGDIINNIADGQYFNGGGIYANHIIKVSGNANISNNTAYTGGGIHVASHEDSSFEITGGTISGNKATGLSGGGGVYYVNDKRESDDIISFMDGGSITNNTAENGSGGGLYVSAGSFEMRKGTISKNKALFGTGGGILIYTKGIMTFTDGIISKNEANQGGGINITGKLIMNGGKIEENTAKPYYKADTNRVNTNNNGGGIVVNTNGKFVMNNGSISRNTAKYGGGICTWIPEQFEIHGGEISNNSTENMTYVDSDGVTQTVKGTYGGGISLGNSTNMVFTGGKIINNHANTNGGGIYVPYKESESEKIHVSVSGNPIVTGNMANDKAGNIYLSANGENALITLTDNLTNGATIGVTTAVAPSVSSEVQITTAETDTEYYKDSAKYFVPDAEHVIVQSDDTEKYLKLAYSNENYYKVTLNLSHASATGGTITQVKEGNSYTAAVTADTGYTLPTEMPNGLTSYDRGNNNTLANIGISNVAGNQTIDIAAIPNKYTVTFDGNSNTDGTMEVQTMTYDTSAALSENKFTKTGYNFAGWSTTAEGTSEYPDKVSVKNLTAENNGNVTLYAVWTKKETIPAFDSGENAVQSRKYDGTGKAYTLTSELEGFTISYKKGEETVAAPTAVGTYDVIITRAEDDTYEAFSQTITGGLVITAADYPVSVVADKEKMRGAGTVKITASSTVDEIKVTDIICSDDSIKCTKNEDGIYSASLPNATKTYIFTAQIEGDLSNYGEGTASCTVSVSRKKSSSSSDTSAPTYGVSTGKTENGEISVTPAKAEAGETVTIKATPDSGYQLDKVTVKDKNNSNVKLTKVNDNEYTFTMPSGKVSVDATFVQKDAADDNQNNVGETSKVIKLQIGSRIVTVDNEAVIYDVAPVIRNDRTLVPIRIVTETLGGKVDWNGVTKEVTLNIDGKEIKMTVGKTLEKYGVAPVIIDGRTFVPVRFVADELGATVAWDDATKTVTITKIEK